MMSVWTIRATLVQGLSSDEKEREGGTGTEGERESARESTPERVEGWEQMICCTLLANSISLK